MKSSFMGWIYRMRFIKRWNRMHIQRETDVDLHSHCLNVSVVSHLLAQIANTYHGENYEAERIAMLGLYHEMSESLIGDLASPVKYASKEITREIKRMEDETERTCVKSLPEQLQANMASFIIQKDIPKKEKQLVKAADDMVALAKAKEEVQVAGNLDFSDAYSNLQAKVNVHASEIPAVQTYIELFAEGYAKSIDQLMRGDV